MPIKYFYVHYSNIAYLLQVKSLITTQLKARKLGKNNSSITTPNADTNANHAHTPVTSNYIYDNRVYETTKVNI